jgi:hypothetical protein
MDSGLDASHRPGMTVGGLRARAADVRNDGGEVSFRTPRTGLSFVIPGRRSAPSPESITTELRLGRDGAPVMFESAVLLMDSGLDAPHRPGMTVGGLRARAGRAFANGNGASTFPVLAESRPVNSSQRT